jgi:type VI secretion system ImpH/TssG family protein
MAAASRDSSSALTGQTSVDRRTNRVSESSQDAGRRAVPRAFLSGCAHAPEDGAGTQAGRILRHAAGETIRFSARTSLGFPPSEIYQLQRMENGQMSMTVEFMGLCAAISVMPAPYTEFLLERIRQKDHAMEDFLNIFNHRMISFFYRGWEKYRFFIEYERTRDDRLSTRLMDSAGSWH